MSTNFVQFPPKGITVYPSAVNFPPTSFKGDQAIAADTETIYLYDTTVPGWVPVANPGGAIAIDGLTGDVSATGPGVVVATVNAVGGQTAANVATATTLVNSSNSGNKVLASPANGSSGAATFRALTAADIPSLSATYANVTLSNLTNPTALNQPLFEGIGSAAAPTYSFQGNSSNQQSGMYCTGSPGAPAITHAGSEVCSFNSGDGNKSLINSRTGNNFFELDDLDNGHRMMLQCVGQLWFNVEAAAVATWYNTEVDFMVPMRLTESTGAFGIAHTYPSGGTSDYTVTWPALQGGANSILRNDGSGNLSWATSGAGTGTVTSVALTVPNILSVSGSPITTSGTLAVSLATQTANIVFAGPTSGGAATPTFRSLVTADLPAGTGTVTSVALTVPSFLSVSGSPITTSGTLAVSLSGTALPVANGGTGITTVPSNGFVPIGNGTNYTAAALTAGAGISITNGSGSITIASSTVANVSTITSNTNLAANGTYYCDTSGGSFTVTLPAPSTSATIILKDSKGTFNANNLIVAQHASELIEGIAASKILQTNWQAITFRSDGTNWFMF